MPGDYYSIDDLEIANRADVPVRIIHSHCTENMGGKLTAIMHSVNRRRVISIASDCFACSQGAGEYFYPSKSRYKLARNAFDVEKFAFNEDDRLKVRDELGIEESTLVICHVGRFSSEKNHNKILHVLARIRCIDPDVKLLLCGEGPLLEETINLATQIGLKDIVEFLGVIDNIPAILSASDVFIFPSLHEGLPYALLEAQANGLPCVVSDNVNLDGFLQENIKSISVSSSDDIWAATCNSISKTRVRSIADYYLQHYSLKSETYQIREYILKQLTSK